MSSKPTSIAPVDVTVARLPDWQVLEAAGADALAFLQRQTMNDVAALADGGAQWNGVLSAKGRVLALFVLVRRNPQCAWLLVPDQPADELAALLRPFVLRSKLTLAPRPDLAVVGTRGNAAAGLALLAQAPVGAQAGERRVGLLAAADAHALAADDGHWKFDDLSEGIPRLDAAQRDAWTAHMLSLNRLDAFSLKKGCYPGQEIVARTHYLGRVKRGLWRVRADAAITPGAAVHDADGAEIGSVVAAASWRDEQVGLVVAPLDAAPLPWRIGDRGVKTESLAARPSTRA